MRACRHFAGRHHRRRGLASFLARCFIASVTTADTKPEPSTLPPKIPLRDFFKNPVSRGYDLSRDGTMLSFLPPWESRMNIFVRPIAGGEAKRFTSEKERDIRDYTWKGNKFLVSAMDNKGDENFHVKRVDLKGGEAKDLTPFPKVRSDIIDDLADVSERLPGRNRSVTLQPCFRSNDGP